MKLLWSIFTLALALDALYDLKNDPQELINLIGRNPDREKYRTEVTRMTGLLVEWLTRVKSQHLETLKARPLFVQIRAEAARP